MLFSGCCMDKENKALYVPVNLMSHGNYAKTILTYLIALTL